MDMAKSEANRRSANFPAGISSDNLLSYASQDTKNNLDVHGKLEEEVNKMLMDGDDRPWTKLDLIDAIQRLGISYHFEEKIDEILGQIHATHLDCNHWDNHDNSLYNSALLFRLLRQHGYNVSSDMFNKFKDDKGKLDESLAGDVRGMLSLYEATHMRIHGEDILDEALVFTTKHLKSMAENLSPPLSAQISHSLSLPLRKNLPRLEARHYMSVYEDKDNPLHNQVVLTFAKLDFNILQTQHQKELADLSRWWKDLEISKKLSFARDRIAECYFWILGVCFEPEYLLGRQMFTKILALSTVLDDIYDAYGILEELQLLTEAIERWDLSAIDNLPEYMKVFYQEFLLLYNQIGEIMIAQGNSYRNHYAREAVKLLARAYFNEAKWFLNKYVPPTMEEFMEVGLRTSCYSNLSILTFLGMGNIVNEDAFDWALNIESSKMVKAASTLYRLIDDIKTHEFEKERGHATTSVECYMKQHGATKQETVDEFYRQVDDAWKDINEECLRPFRFPLPVLRPMINLVRAVHVIYKDGDGYTFSQLLLKDKFASMLVDPVPLPEI